MNGLPGYWVASNPIAPSQPVGVTTAIPVAPMPKTDSAFSEINKQLGAVVQTMSSMAEHLRNLPMKRSMTYVTRPYSGPGKRRQIPQEILQKMTCHECGEKGHIRWQCNKARREDKVGGEEKGKAKITEL